MDIVPDLENSTSVQYSGVVGSEELLYMGTSNQSGVLMVDHRYAVTVGRLETLAPVQATPILVDFADTKRLFAVDLSGQVYCWSLPEERPVQQEPSRLSGKSSRDSEHRLLWTTSLNIPVNTPIETDGKQLFISTNNDVVYALDTNGNILWRFTHKVSPSRKGNLQLFGAGSPLLDGDSIVVGFSDGAVLRLSKEEGTVIEQMYNGDGRYPDVIAQPTAIQGGILISGFEQPSYKEKDEVILWSKDFGSVQGAIVDPNEGNGTLVYHAGSDGKLRKLDTTSGTALWEWDSKTDSALTVPVWLGDQLLIASHVAGLYLIDRQTGEGTWTSRLSHRQTGYMQSPYVSGCTAHVISAKGFLEQYRVCIDN
jgi:outer membrane protein assembly factor BamB